MYNLMMSKGRQQLRSDREAELEAVERGNWPRSIEDVLRWSPPVGGDPAQWAAQMCRADLKYLEDLKARLEVGDPALDGWER